ncbi:hypothetical protein B0H66DRAFT_600594 [Apodospora peruviana]|uniref:Cell wall biogenesis protein Mhp1 n=1 Tax=Apodospora peruviana TaxID=516989 RepID=A0AAE0IK36_9PEZI|nr:hypothetical protein B0H66DRAFT_600594 [Apodospora peruviana]
MSNESLMHLPIITDKLTKAVRQRSLSQQTRDSSTLSAPSDSQRPATTANGAQIDSSMSQPAVQQIPPKQSTPVRPSFTRTSSDEKRAPQPGTSPQRRGSWFSNISSKFSSSDRVQSPPQANNTSPKPAELSIPKANPAKNAVLQHASKHEGEGPYTPAPPRSQAGILHVLRRLSSANGSLNPPARPHNHGLVERRVLNVDQHRERCDISGLNQAKLRRVAFCVDVEIAPMPKYVDGPSWAKNCSSDKSDKDQKKKIKEKGEGEALKNPKVVECQKDQDGEIKAIGEEVPKEPTKEGAGGAAEVVQGASNKVTSSENQTEKGNAESKKKEKKKKSEEERKARKEKKRKLAEANGTIPMEIHMDSDSSSCETVPRPETPRTQAVPTTNPVRIYRRCCQLRETPILKKITEQLVNPANQSEEPGMIERLDLTGYWMQLPDLVTLGDYLAVVPVKEVILENCGLADEGLRVILAGLLASRKVTGKKRKPVPEGLTHQGGVVERLVLKNNKLGPEGWKHICLFIYLCRTLKILDLSGIPFPQTPASNRQNGITNGARQSMDTCRLLSKSVGERLGGSTLGLLSLGETGLNAEQLGLVIDGVISCGIKRLGLAHNNIQGEGLDHVARLLRSGICEGLDLGGNDLRDQLAVLAEALQGEDCPLWALSLADSNLIPSSLCKLLPKLVKLQHFRFIDLSHNHELFSSNPSAISVLRRYLPKMACLKRIHLADCGLSTEQVIALAEILPEIPGLAHVSFLENPLVVEVATNAHTEETKEEACALFASLLAAARVSSNLVAVDIEVPSEQSSDLVKAMARQVVAYCLRNMEHLPLPVPEMAAIAVHTETPLSASFSSAELQYPDVLQRLVGHDVTQPGDDLDADLDVAPDDDYVIGGTGVVKALACCLKNRGDESRRQSGEFIRDVENGVSHPRPTLPSGKAKETSKHLLLSARRIRHRLQPAIIKAKAVDHGSHAYHRLIFLDNTLEGIIKRFEDEFPDTRESVDSAVGFSSSNSDEEDAVEKQLTLSPSAEADFMVEDDQESAGLEIRTPSLVRSDSTLSLSSKALANEEGRVLRAGHKFRAGIVKPAHYPLLSGVELVGADPRHVRLLHELLDDIGDESLIQDAKEKGVVRVFQERKEDILKLLKEADPIYWDRFVESQEMARANVALHAPPGADGKGPAADARTEKDGAGATAAVVPAASEGRGDSAVHD